MMWLMLCRLAVKVAVTVAAPETVQVVPLADLHPVQPPKVNPWPAAAVRVKVGEFLNVN
jgi:hypothetical protein